MRTIAFLILVFLGVFTGTAVAAESISSAEPSLSEAIKAAFDAVSQGNWWLAASYGVILATIGVRKILPQEFREGVKGDIVGTATAFLIAFALGIASVIVAPGATMSLAVVATAAKVGIGAIGGYTVVHKLAGWLMSTGKMPVWLMPLLKLVTTLVGSNAVKKAETAGDKAVAAKPPTGMGAVDREVE